MHFDTEAAQGPPQENNSNLPLASVELPPRPHVDSKGASPQKELTRLEKLRCMLEQRIPGPLRLDGLHALRNKVMSAALEELSSLPNLSAVTAPTALEIAQYLLGKHPTGTALPAVLSVMDPERPRESHTLAYLRDARRRSESEAAHWTKRLTTERETRLSLENRRQRLMESVGQAEGLQQKLREDLDALPLLLKAIPGAIREELETIVEIRPPELPWWKALVPGATARATSAKIEESLERWKELKRKEIGSLASELQALKHQESEPLPTPERSLYPITPEELPRFLFPEALRKTYEDRSTSRGAHGELRSAIELAEESARIWKLREGFEVAARLLETLADESSVSPLAPSTPISSAAIKLLCDGYSRIREILDTREELDQKLVEQQTKKLAATSAAELQHAINELTSLEKQNDALARELGKLTEEHGTRIRQLGAMLAEQAANEMYRATQPALHELKKGIAGFSDRVKDAFPGPAPEATAASGDPDETVFNFSPAEDPWWEADRDQTEGGFEETSDSTSETLLAPTMPPTDTHYFIRALEVAAFTLEQCSARAFASWVDEQVLHQLQCVSGTEIPAAMQEREKLSYLKGGGRVIELTSRITSNTWSYRNDPHTDCIMDLVLPQQLLKVSNPSLAKDLYSARAATDGRIPGALLALPGSLLSYRAISSSCKALEGSLWLPVPKEILAEDLALAVQCFRRRAHTELRNIERTVLSFKKERGENFKAANGRGTASSEAPQNSFELRSAKITMHATAEIRAGRQSSRPV